MPALRFPSNGIFRIADHITTGHMVDVLTKDGGTIRMTWCGFLCIPALRYIAGKYAKIVAIDISPDDGGFNARWHKVTWSEFVLGWVVEYYGKDGLTRGVYGVVGADGWPIVKPRGKAPPSNRALVVPISAAATKS